MSTGGLPFGFASEPVLGPNGRVVGRRLIVFAERAEVVRSIFADYLAGRSLSAIARALNERGIESPRGRSRHQQKGWSAGTIRALLHNERFIGIWTFKSTKWMKAPGSNKRKPQPRPPSEQIRQHHPELRVIDEVTWREVQTRLKAIHAKYTKTSDGSPKITAQPGRATTYALSGLLFCGACGNTMSNSGGGSATYLRCARAMKRGSCSNRASVREDVARERIFGFINAALAAPDGVADVRRRVAEQLGELHRQRGERRAEHEERLRRTEGRIANLVGFLADGERSEAVVLALRDLESQAAAEKNAIAAIERESAAPVRLPSPAEVLQRVAALEARVRADPTAGRELLRRLLKDGRIMLTLSAGGIYEASGELLPAVLFLETTTPGSGGVPGPASCSSASSGGALHGLNTAVSLAFEVRLAA